MASRSIYYSTTDFATRYDYYVNPSFDSDYRRDCYYQQPHSSDRIEDFASQLPSLISVAKYLATSPSADCPSTDRPRKPFDDEIEQLSAHLKRVTALKAASALPQQQAAPPKSFTELQSRYISFYNKYVAIGSSPLFFY